MSPALCELAAVTRTHVLPGSTVNALAQVNWSLGHGEYVAVRGPSGSGKSTLLQILGLLDRPTSGAQCFEGRAVTELSDRERSRLRGERIGFVFQTFQLVPELDVLENIALPFLYRGVTRREARRRAQASAERVGLAERVVHRPAELSGGEQQRVAVARALAMEPALILADEPTGNLDRATGAGILALFEELHGDGRSLVVVTHDDAVAARAERSVTLLDGVLLDGELAS